MGIATNPTRRRRKRFSAVRTAVHMGVITALVLSATLVVSGTAHAASPTGKKTFTNSTNYPIGDAPTEFPQVDSTIAVSGLTGNITNVTISMYVTGKVSDLDAAVLGPTYPSDNSTFAYLFSHLSDSGDDFGSSCGDSDRTAFDDAASSTIDSGSSPYTGSFKTSPNTSPVQPLSTFDGLTPTDGNGDWVLDVLNSGIGGASIECWSLFITTAEDGLQRFDSSDTPVGGTPTDEPPAVSPINVSGMVGPLAELTISVYITHPTDSQLTLTLKSPDGTTKVLAAGNGGSGDNFGSSCSASQMTKFDQTAQFALTTATAPFVGTYLPKNSIAPFLGDSGDDLNGEWDLTVSDSVDGDTGILRCWSISVSASPLVVYPHFSTPPLYGTYNNAYFVVTNTTDDAVANVTLTSTLPKTMNDLYAIPDAFPGCTLSGRKLTCHFGSIDANSSVFGGLLGNTLKVASNKQCLAGTAVGDGIKATTGSACFSMIAYAPVDHGTGYTVGKKAHNFKLRDENNNQVSLGQYAGKWVMVTFTAVWCSPSQFETPIVRDDIKDLNDNNTMGGEVVWLNVLIDGPTPNAASSKQNAINWVNHHHLTTPTLWTANDVKQIARKMFTTYGTKAGVVNGAYPTSVLMRPDGTIFDVKVGAFQNSGDVVAAFESQLP